MSETPLIKNRLDTLDFLINFLIEHEKKIERIISRLEKLENKYTKRVADCNNCEAKTIQTPLLLDKEQHAD